MSPKNPFLLVAVAAMGKDRVKLPQALAQKLRRRGLKVQLLHDSYENALPGSDVLLFSCADGGGEDLADRVEKIWTCNWDQWYAGAQKEGMLSSCRCCSCSGKE